MNHPQRKFKEVLQSYGLKDLDIDVALSGSFVDAHILLRLAAGIYATELMAVALGLPENAGINSIKREWDNMQAGKTP